MYTARYKHLNMIYFVWATVIVRSYCKLRCQINVARLTFGNKLILNSVFDDLFLLGKNYVYAKIFIDFIKLDTSSSMISDYN